MPHDTGMCAIRAERDYVINEDFSKAVRKVVKIVWCYFELSAMLQVAESKKLETTLDYKKI